MEKLTYNKKESKYGPLMSAADFEKLCRYGIQVEEYWRAKKTSRCGVQEFRKKVAQIKRNQEFAARNKTKKRKEVEL